MSRRSDDEWLGIEGTRGDKPLLARLRKLANTKAQRGALSHLFLIEWPYPLDNDTELPSKSVYKQLSRFEEQVLDALEDDAEGKLFFVETSGGTVTYHLYCRDPEVAAERVNDAVPAKIELQLSSRPDPNWDDYRAICKALL